MTNPITFHAALDDGSKRRIAIAAQDHDPTASGAESVKLYSLTDMQTEESLGVLEVDHENKTWSSQDCYLSAYEIKQIGDYILNLKEPGVK